MASVGDIARIRPLDKSIASEIPDVNDPEAIKVAAELVWKNLQAKIKKNPYSVVKKRDGRPGHEWQGRILTEVIYEIWPRMIDRVLIPHEKSKATSSALLDYMIECQVIGPIHGTIATTAAKWWVSDNFTPITIVQRVTELVEANAVEEPGELTVAQTEADGTYPCREPGCNLAYTSANGRSGHEYNSHRLVANAADERFYVDDEDFTPKYIVDSIIAALTVAGKPLTFYGLSSLTYDQDPRLGKPMVRETLGALVGAGMVKNFQRGQYTYFELTDKTADPERLSTVIEGQQEKTEERAAQITNVAPVAADLRSGIAFSKHVLSSAMGGFASVQKALEELERYADEKDREIAGLRQRLMAAPKESKELTELKAELENVKAERDLYKGKVTAFESALRGLRTS